MDSEDSVPFLPPELERTIFESAAELHPGTILNLLLVSRRVNEWIERLQYNTVTSSGSGTSCRFDVLQRAVRSDLKPASFFHDRVQYLYVDWRNKDGLRSAEILSACSGIRSLVLLFLVGPSLLSSLGAMKPQRLGIFLKGIFPTMESTDLSHPMFTFVTHLDIFDSLSHDFYDFHWPWSDDWSWSNFGLLPALTHLSLLKFRDSDVGTVLLSQCRKLEVLIRMAGSAPHPSDLPSIDDVRFVSMVVPDRDYEGDWIIGTKGEMDFWARADAFVAKRRRGEVKPDSRYWIEDGDGI
ncbi:hypothetical protein C8R44DRAFT_985491 [Mycena epipterygia]|nr:hypothetical protein C8R44DRAFT_985491 [Mycena epipterygia]